MIATPSQSVANVVGDAFTDPALLAIRRRKADSKTIPAILTIESLARMFSPPHQWKEFFRVRWLTTLIVERFLPMCPMSPNGARAENSLRVDKEKIS
jgi:hypothetical protein